MLEKNGDRFKEKIFTNKEIAYCDGKSNPSIHFAGRFAAKEAIKKCIYSSGYNKEIAFSKIEILPESNLLNLKNLAAVIVIPALLTPGIKASI